MTLLFPLNINQGETYSVTFPVVDANGAPVNVTGWTARSQIRQTPVDAILYEWSAANHNIVVTGTTVTLTVSPADSSLWEWTSARYDLDLTDLSGNVSRLAEGDVCVSPAITY